MASQRSNKNVSRPLNFSPDRFRYQNQTKTIVIQVVANYSFETFVVLRALWFKFFRIDSDLVQLHIKQINPFIQNSTAARPSLKTIRFHNYIFSNQPQNAKCSSHRSNQKLSRPRNFSPDSFRDQSYTNTIVIKLVARKLLIRNFCGLQKF